MKITLLLLLIVSIAHADFANDQYAPEPQALSRIVAATEQHGAPLRSHRDETTSYYPKDAEYVGPCEAPFGTVHIARLFYIRSIAPGSKGAPRGHTFVVFADQNFRIRGYWRVEPDLGKLSVSGSKLCVDDKTILDYKALPERGTVLVDGQIQGIPTWKE